MTSLQSMLDQRTHRDLELIARAHKIPFTRREPKAEGLATLSQILHREHYKKAFEALSSEHLEALQALVIAGDWMPLHLFEHHFGEIHPYKPWRVPHRAYLEHPTRRHPWRYPLSVAERLYHLGFIQIHDWQMVEIVDEVKSWLSLPSIVASEMRVEHQSSMTRQALLHDIGAMLGVLMQANAHPIHGRWLSLKTIRDINQVLCCPEAGLNNKIRSELQTGRLRWLHYLAQASGLLSIHDGVWLPTAKAWHWLSAESDEQWSDLIYAVDQDLAQPTSLWDTFRFPEIDAYTWQVLYRTISALSPAETYRVKDIFTLTKPHLLPASRYHIASVLQQLFTWSGILLVRHGHFYVHPPLSHADTRFQGKLCVGDDVIQLTLPRSPSSELTTLLAFAEVKQGVAHLHKEAVKIAVQQGFDATTIITTINALSSEPLSEGTHAQIQNWINDARQLVLQAMVVLYSPDADVIQKIRSDYRLAEHFIERLSPNHLAIVAEKANQFISRLERRGLNITSFVKPTRTRRITQEINSDMAEYLLLAVRTYQKLQSRLDAQVYIPNALKHWLSSQVNNPASIEVSADSLVKAVQSQVPQRIPLIDEHRHDEITIQHQIEQAHYHTKPITIDYYSPSSEGDSTRTIRIEEIYESGSETYIEAYCYLVKDMRTFRMDRIQRVYPLKDKIS